MSNSYTNITPIEFPDELIATEEEIIKLRELLKYEGEDYEFCHGMSLAHCAYDSMGKTIAHKVAVLHGNDCADYNALPPEFLEAYGQFIASKGMEYQEFDIQYDHDKPDCGNLGGSKFRIYADGEVVEPTLVWEHPPKGHIEY